MISTPIKLSLLMEFIAPFFPRNTHDKLDVCLFLLHLSKAKYKPVIEAYFNKVAKEESLTSLNTAFAKEGAYINIPKHKEVEKPVEIYQLFIRAMKYRCYAATTKFDCCRRKCSRSNH